MAAKRIKRRCFVQPFDDDTSCQLLMQNPVGSASGAGGLCMRPCIPAEQTVMMTENTLLCRTNSFLLAHVESSSSREEVATLGRWSYPSVLADYEPRSFGDVNGKLRNASRSNQRRPSATGLRELRYGEVGQWPYSPEKHWNARGMVRALLTLGLHWTPLP